MRLPAAQITTPVLFRAFGLSERTLACLHHGQHLSTEHARSSIQSRIGTFPDAISGRQLTGGAAALCAATAEEDFVAIGPSDRAQQRSSHRRRAALWRRRARARGLRRFRAGVIVAGLAGRGRGAYRGGDLVGADRRGVVRNPELVRLDEHAHLLDPLSPYQGELHRTGALLSGHAREREALLDRCRPRRRRPDEEGRCAQNG